MIALNNERMVRHAPESRQAKKEVEVKKVVITVWDYNIIGFFFFSFFFFFFFFFFSFLFFSFLFFSFLFFSFLLFIFLQMKMISWVA